MRLLRCCWLCGVVSLIACSLYGCAVVRQGNVQAVVHHVAQGGSEKPEEAPGTLGGRAAAICRPAKQQVCGVCACVCLYVHSGGWKHNYAGADGLQASGTGYCSFFRCG